jgi:hypothetical protein
MKNFELNGIIINGVRYDVVNVIKPQKNCDDCDIVEVCQWFDLPEKCCDVIGYKKFKKSDKQFEL